MINAYCPLLLLIWDCAMDIQINRTDRVSPYLAKCLTKSDTHVNVEFGAQTAQEHFQRRKIAS